jgi:hypothetical protein
MKCYSQEHVSDTAKRFAESPYADMWSLFRADIRRALIDAHVMNELRIADTVNSEILFTASEVMAFRHAVEAKLAEGVKKHSRAMKRSFKIEEE